MFTNCPKLQTDSLLRCIINLIRSKKLSGITLLLNLLKQGFTPFNPYFYIIWFTEKQYYYNTFSNFSQKLFTYT